MCQKLFTAYRHIFKYICPLHKKQDCACFIKIIFLELNIILGFYLKMKSLLTLRRIFPLLLPLHFIFPLLRQFCAQPHARGECLCSHVGLTVTLQGKFVVLSEKHRARRGISDISRCQQVDLIFSIAVCNLLFYTPQHSQRMNSMHSDINQRLAIILELLASGIANRLQLLDTS